MPQMWRARDGGSTLRAMKLWAILIVAVLALAGCTSSGKDPCNKICQASIERADSSYMASLSAAAATETVSDAPEYDGPPMVVYTLTGTASTADITYSTGGDGQEQQQGIDVPLVNSGTGEQGITFPATAGDFLYFSAQNDGDGTLTCTITEGGAVVSTHTSSGSYAIVTCEGTA